MSTDRRYPPGTVPAAVVTLALIGFLLAAGALGVSALLRGCDRPAPVQMIQTPPPAASSAAIGTSSAQATAGQSTMATVTIDEWEDPSDEIASQAPGSARKVVHDSAASGSTHRRIAVTLAATQAVSVMAASSAQASASVKAPDNMDGGNGRLLQDQARNLNNDHGRLGVIAATMPGILAADLELARVDVPPWVVGMPLELGLDVAGNLEAGAAGLTVGSKAFAGVYGWSRWNLSAQGIGVGVGLRF